MAKYVNRHATSHKYIYMYIIHMLQILINFIINLCPSKSLLPLLSNSRKYTVLPMASPGLPQNSKFEIWLLLYILLVYHCRAENLLGKAFGKAIKHWLGSTGPILEGLTPLLIPACFLLSVPGEAGSDGTGSWVPATHM